MPRQLNLPNALHPSSRSRSVLVSILVAAAFLLPTLLLFSVPSDTFLAGSDLRTAAGPEWNVTFTETGLPSGTSWTAVLAGTHHMSVTNQIVVLQGIGNYTYQILPLTGWAPNITGVHHVVVLSADVFINVTFLPAWNVNISESGLPALTAWNVTYNGTAHSTETPTFTFILSNASYTFTVQNPVNGSTGVRYVPAVTSYKLTVAGKNINRTDVFTTQVLLTTSASPANGGTASPATEWVTNGSSVTLGETPAAGYAFQGWSGTGSGSYTGTNVSQKITLKGPVNEVAGFQAQYTVTFSESGLPASTSWNVTLSGVLHTSTTSTILFTMPNGSFPFSVGAVSGFVPSPASGIVGVAGAPVLEPIAFAPFTYALTFTETGLVAGTSWSVNVSGSLQSSTTATIVFQEPNGTYHYVITPIAGYTTQPYSANTTVSSAAVQVPVAWTRLGYSVTFTESGLPSGTLWAVTLGGQLLNSTMTSIVFTEPNGSYTYVVQGVAGYAPTPSGGPVTVNGVAQTIPISWSVRMYAVTFTETGLATSTAWSVTLGGVKTTSSTATISFQEPNGSFAFSVGSIPGFSAAPNAGTAVVSGQPVSKAIVWSEVYTLSVTETGLPTGTNWSASVSGTLGSSTGSLITFELANGTYTVLVIPIPGFIPNAYQMSVTIAGSSTVAAVTWQAATFTLTFTESGLANGTQWSVTVDGSLQSSVTTTMTFHEPNGTHSFTVENLSGYSVLPLSGNVMVAGHPVQEAVAYTAVSTSSSSGLSTFDIELIGGIVALLAILGIVVVLARRRRKAPPPLKPAA